MEEVEPIRGGRMKRSLQKSSRKVYRWLRHPRHRKRSRFRNWLAGRVFDRRMWTHPTAHSFAGGLAVGLAFGMILILGQMFVAAVVCCMLRVHIPVAVVTVWISNPLTFVPMIAFQTWLGKWLFSLSSLQPVMIDKLGDGAAAVVHFYTGGVFCALAAVIIGYPVGLWIGTRVVARREARMEAKLERARERAAARAERELSGADEVPETGFSTAKGIGGDG